MNTQDRGLPSPFSSISQRSLLFQWQPICKWGDIVQGVQGHMSMELLLHGYVFRWDKYMCVHLSMYECVWMHGCVWNWRSRHAMEAYGVLIHTSGIHSPTWAPQESPSRWNKGKQRFWSSGEAETDVIHEWMGRAVQLHPCLVHLGAGLHRGWVPSLQDMWHIHVTAWSIVVIKPRGSKRLIP